MQWPSIGFGREQAAVLIDISVIAGAHVKVVHFFNLFTVFREMSLQVSVEPLSPCSAALRINFSEQVTANLGLNAYSSLPLSARCHLRQSRSLSSKETERIFFGCSCPVGTDVHHHFSENHSQPAVAARLRSRRRSCPR